ncbi:MAG: NAD(+)/NADH kinase [Myxococcales bacterium]|nr:NAD(+)/NADH kinase [Myxococcales bacterium]
MRIGFILKPVQNSDAQNVLSTMAAWAIEQGHETMVVAEDRVNPLGAVLVPESKFGDSVDLCVVMGGDGTMLRASATMARADPARSVPLLGINLGRLGFLSPFDPADAVESLDAAISGKLDTVERMRLKITYRPLVGRSVVRSALNDVVISQGAMARLVELQAHRDGEFINSYRADGLVVCTPTGSTAYNLAAGGPIMYPGLNALAITPICAQGLTNRPLVVPGQGKVLISMSGESKGVVLTIDGQWAHTFQTGDKVEITPSDAPAVIFTSDSDYFNILRAKLHWGVQPVR